MAPKLLFFIGVFLAELGLLDNELNHDRDLVSFDVVVKDEGGGGACLGVGWGEVFSFR